MIKQWQTENNQILPLYPPECFLHQFGWSWCHHVIIAWCSTLWPGMITLRSSLTSQVRPSSATLTRRSVWPRTRSLCTLGRRSSRFVLNLYHFNVRRVVPSFVIWEILTSSVCLPECDSAADRVSGHGSASAGSAGLWGGRRREASGWRRVAVWRTRCGSIGP